ncbi:hypothetical protein PR202_gb03564 [Eleusine coracana subsp. coracana]|uniref:Uncharacterized protein n=1 Tax=Eleusine coracana subsp. coracana TaxID=191504 RepID=A0AAV5E1Y1_ELECO|nr:hypothetical protein PR202_gb03547 [Eleusine coracana subsp. coracana]GJN16562.1 hypothetical protein PR202_gb03564 [Eleusine coracana subsp. coracana]
MHMQVTLAMQPLFKRSVTFKNRDELDLPAKVAVWGHLHEFGDIKWLPQEDAACVLPLPAPFAAPVTCLPSIGSTFFYGPTERFGGPAP